MHEIEPYYQWRDYYIASNDKLSPFYGRKYSEMHFTHSIYNHYIHPQWDFFGSSTLYCKVLYTDYDKQFCVMEFIGEWNDAVHNDIMELKRTVIDILTKRAIVKFILIGENVLNFHGSDDLYYEEWYDDIVVLTIDVSKLDLTKIEKDKNYSGNFTTDEMTYTYMYKGSIKPEAIVSYD